MADEPAAAAVVTAPDEVPDVAEAETVEAEAAAEPEAVTESEAAAEADATEVETATPEADAADSEADAPEKAEA